MIVLSESTGGMRICDKGGNSHDRRRKISYAIQEPEVSRRRKHRMPQIVGLAFFLVLASVITVGLVFGIGDSEQKMKNETYHNFRNKVASSKEIFEGPQRMEPTQLQLGPTEALPTSRPKEFNVTVSKPKIDVEQKVKVKVVESCEGKEQKYRFGTVNSNSEVCSEQGLTVLARHHGSVVDAALTTLLCLGVVHPHLSGLGGGFFMLVYDRDNKTTHTLDGRVQAPSRATRYMFEKKLDAAKQGTLSIATPGEIHGYWTAHQTFGKLPWRDLFTPAIKLASDGFTVSEQLSTAIKTNQYKVHRNAQLKRLFIDRRTGNPLKSGDIITNAPLANTLTKLAKNGANEFYNGSLSKTIMLELLQDGGSLSLEDLLNYQSKWRTPVTTSLKNNTLDMKTMPLPASGQLLALVTNILDGYYSNSSVDDTELAYHRLIEAVKFAMARKLYLGDPDFLTMDQFVKGLDTREYADTVRNLITDQTHDAMYYGTQNGVSDQGTSVVIVRNPNGDVAVASSSLGGDFGSGLLGRYTGILYNNAMKDFNLPQTPPTFDIIPPDSNFIQAAKRPLSSMSPCIVVDSGSGDVVLAMAAGGGPSGLSALALIILRTLYMNMDLKQAVDAPYLHNDWLPPFTDFETSLEKEIVFALKQRGHIMAGRQSAAFVNAVLQKHMFLYSYADSRKGGCVDGY